MKFERGVKKPYLLHIQQCCCAVLGNMELLIKPLNSK